MDNCASVYIANFYGPQLQGEGIREYIVCVCVRHWWHITDSVYVRVCARSRYNVLCLGPSDALLPFCIPAVEVSCPDGREMGKRSPDVVYPWSAHHPLPGSTAPSTLAHCSGLAERRPERSIGRPSRCNDSTFVKIKATEIGNGAHLQTYAPTFVPLTGAPHGEIGMHEECDVMPANMSAPLPYKRVFYFGVGH